MSFHGSPSGKQLNLLSKSQSFKYSQDCSECPICMRTIKERGKIPCCDHLFCFSCIMEWSKVTNSCPLCKRPFNTVERCTLSGKRIKIPGKTSVVHVEDRKPDNDILVEGYVFYQSNNLNEYVQDDFLVDDDAPIIYETQATGTESDLAPVNNLAYYSLYDSESEASFPRRSARQRRYNQQRIEERSLRDESIVMRRRRRRAVIESDVEETIIDSDSPSHLSSPCVSRTIIQQSWPTSPILPVHRRMENDPEDIFLVESSQDDISTNSSQTDQVVLPQQPTQTTLFAQPAQSIQPIHTTQSSGFHPPFASIHEICTDSIEDRDPTSRSRSAMNHLVQGFYPTGNNSLKRQESGADRTGIVPETPTKKKRSRDASEEYTSYRLSRML